MSSSSAVVFFSSRRRHTRCSRDWSSDVCSSDLSFLHIERRAAGNQQQVEGRAQGLLRFRGIFSAFPFRVVANRVHHHFAPEDRKSTRLNSSHGYISYAVFCLKKKNTVAFNPRRMFLSHAVVAAQHMTPR